MKDDAAQSSAAVLSPFNLVDEDCYQQWKLEKLRDYPASMESLQVTLRDPRNLAREERAKLLMLCEKTGMALYTSEVGGVEDKNIVRLLGRQCGLTRLDNNLLADEDSVSSISTESGKSGRGYIPYSNQRLLWHTDGYYNPPDRRVRAFILHCVRPAESGGENALLDPEIAYLLLRDENPDFIAALMAPDALTIPANEETGARAAQAGPVFSIDRETGRLHMRYTARTHSVIWKDDTLTQAAVQALSRLLELNSPYIFRARLQAGQGLLCNNVLHNRTAFTDAVDKGTKRLLYRARHFDRIRGIAVQDA